MVTCPLAVKRKCAASLLILSSILPEIGISTLVLAARTRFFTSVLWIVANGSNATSCLRVTSAELWLMIWQIVLYPLGALRSSKTTFTTLASLLREILSPITGADVASKRSSAGVGGGNTSFSALRVIAWSVVRWRYTKSSAIWFNRKRPRASDCWPSTAMVQS